MQKRIAIACRHMAGVTGSTSILLEHAWRLTTYGWEVHIYGEKLDVKRIRQTGATAHALVRWPWGSYSKRRFFAWNFARAVRDESFNLICGNGDIFVQDILLLHNCVHAAYETIYSEPLPQHAGVGRIHSRILQRQNFRLLIANSQLMQREIIQRFGVPPAKVKVIYPGYDPQRFHVEGRQVFRLPMRRKLGVGDNEVLVGLITSGDFVKRGVTVFLSALGRLAPEIKARVQVLIVGQESRLERYQRQAAETGLGQRIQFLPPTPQVESYYHALDVYVHPALYEEFGMSVQEAMACGVPVLTSAQVGATELLLGEARDMLLEYPDAEALSQQLQMLISNADIRQRWGEWGVRACRHNTWKEHFSQFMACYESLLTPT